MEPYLLIALSWLGGLASATAFFVAGRLYERWKPIAFRVSEWKMEYLQDVNDHGEALYGPVPSNSREAKFLCHVFWFNTKSEPVGLHDVALEFRNAAGERLFAAKGRQGDNSRYVLYVDLLSHKTTALKQFAAAQD